MHKYVIMAALGYWLWCIRACKLYLDDDADIDGHAHLSVLYHAAAPSEMVSS
jgi:hypothetical protein